MTICISPESLKLLAVYFNKKIPGILSDTKNIQYDDFIKKLYEVAFSDLSSVESGLLSGNTTLPEYIMQHMTIVPQLVNNYFNNFPLLKLDYDALTKEINKKQIEVSKLIKNNNKDDYRSFVNSLSMSVSGTSLVTPSIPAQVGRVELINTNFSTTINQENVWDDKTKTYKSSPESSSKKKTSSIQRKIITSNNLNNLQFKLTTLSEIDYYNNPLVDKSLTDKEINKAGFYVLVLVDSNNKIVLFDENGNVSLTGTHPVFPIKRQSNDFDFAKKALVKKYVSQGYSIPDAEQAVKDEVDNYLNALNADISRYENKEVVNFRIDLSRSSIGAIELNSMLGTSLNKVSNTNELQFGKEAVGKATKVTMRVPNYSEAVEIYPNSVDSLSEKDIDILIELMSNPQLKLNGRLITHEVRMDYIRSYMRLDTAGINSIKILPFVVGKNSIKSWTLGNKSYSIKNREEFAKIFKEFIGKYHLLSANDSMIPYNYEVLEFDNALVAAASVTAQRQVVRVNGALMIANKPVGSFGINTLPINEMTEITPIAEITNGEITLSSERITTQTSVINRGTTNIVANSENKLTGVYPYLGFSSMTAEVADDENLFFQSIADASRKNDLLSNMLWSEEALATAWLKDSGWLKVLNLVMKDEFHTKGPKFVASFINNTISLYKGSNKTDLYHEVFHAYFRGLLSEAERTEIYDSMRSENKGKSFTVTVKGKSKTVSFESATPLELEEFLAEEFRKYGRNKSIYNNKLKSPVARFFEKLKELFQKMFGNRSYSEVVALGFVSDLVTSHFADLYSGQIDLGKFVAPSSTVEVFQSVEADESIDMSNAEVRKTMTSMQSIMLSFVDLVVNPSYSNSDVRDAVLQKVMATSSVDFSKPGAEARKLELQKEASRFITTSENKIGGFDAGRNFYALQKEPFLLMAALEYTKRSLEQKYKQKKGLDNELDKKDARMLKVALDNFGDIALIASEGFETFKDDDTTMIGIFLNNYTPLALDNVRSEEDESAAKAEQWNFDKSGAEKTLEEDVDGFTEFMLSTLPMINKAGIKFNSLGIPKFQSYKSIIAKVAIAIAGKGTTEDEMYFALRQAAEKERMQLGQKGPLSYLLQRLGDPRSLEDFVQKQWGEFWKSMNKADIKVVVQKYEKIDKEDEDSIIVTTSGKTSNEASRRINSWSQNFIENGQNQSQEINDDNVYLNDILKQKIYLHPESIKEKWGVNLLIEKESGIVHPNTLESKNELLKKGIRTISPLRYLSDPVGFLNDLGFKFTNSASIIEILTEGSDEYKIPSGFVQYIYDAIANREFALNEADTQIFNFRSIFNPYLYNVGNGVAEQADLSMYLSFIAEMALELDEGALSFTQYNAEGERMSSKSLHSSLSVEISALNNSQSYEELIAIPGMEHYDYTNNPEVAANQSLVAMFNLNLSLTNPNRGKRNPDLKMSIEHLTGTQLVYNDDLKGVKSIESDETTKFNTDFAQTLNGSKQENIRSEAKSTSYITVMPISKSGESVSRTGQNALWINQDELLAVEDDENKQTLLYDVFKNQLESELVRINRNRELQNKVKDGGVIFNQKALARGSSWIKFSLLLSRDTKVKLMALGITESFTIDTVISEELKKQIDADLLAYFSFRAKQLSEEKRNKLVLSDTLLNRFKLENEEEDVTIDRLFKLFIINNYLVNLNYTATFLGDPSNYDIEGLAFHKRLSGKGTTGRLMRHSESWYNYVNSEQFGANALAKIHFNNLTPEQRAERGLGDTYQKAAYNGYLETAIMDEPTSKSIYRDYYNSLLGIPSSKYGKMEEADGSAYVGFDTYRLLAKSHQEWSDRQEDLYQAIVRGENVNQLQIKTTFPVRKYQYYGPVFDKSGNDSSRLQLMSFHKYSVVPMIPALIKGKPMQQIHEMMMEQGLDYVTFKSGSKLSEFTKLDTDGKAIYDKPYSIDSENSNIRTFDRSVKFVKNTIHVRHLKSVVQQAEGYHDSIPLPSQMRKINLVGLFDKDGTPTDYKGKKKWKNLTRAEKLKASENFFWNDEFLNTVDALVVLSKSNMIEDIGLSKTVNENGETIYEGSTKKLATYLKKELKNKNLTQEEITFLFDENDELISDFSLSLVSSKIEEVLIKLIDDNIRGLQMKGEMLVQMSGTMLEDEITFDPTDPTVDNNTKFAYGNNGLSTYYGIKEDGTLATEKDDIKYIKSMEVKIALQGDFMKLVKGTFKGEPITQYMPVIVNGEIVSTTLEIDFDATLVRLNEALKDADWRDKHIDMLTIPATRIPTSQFSMLESMTIKEFLPPMVGPVIILPSEIVAKSGSDFDIDKLFTLFPSLAFIRGNVELIEQLNNVTESRAELMEREKVILNEIDELRKRKDAAYNEKESIFKNYKDISEQIKEQLTDVFKTIDILKAERQQLFDEAELVYKGIGKYANFTVSQKIDYHHAPIVGSKDKMSELSRSIDYLESQITDILKSTFGDLYANEDKKIEDINLAITKLNDDLDNNTRRLNSKGKKGLQNKILMLLNQRITNPAMFKNLAEPNSTDFFLDLSEKLEKKLNKNYDKFDRASIDTNFKPLAGETIAPSTAFDYRYNLLQHQQNSRGLRALGVTAVSSTYYALFTQFGATLKGLTAAQQEDYNKAVTIIAESYGVKPGESLNPELGWAQEYVNEYKNYTLQFDHNKLQNKIALGFINNVEGRSIQDVIGQLINGFVDIAKNPWVYNVQGNMENIPQMLLMVMSGMSVENTVYLSSLPLVIEYNDIKAESSGLFSNLNRDYDSSPLKNKNEGGKLKAAREEIYDRYKDVLVLPPLSSTNLLVHTLKNYNLEESDYLEKRVGVKITKENAVEHFALLEHYFEIEKMAQDFTDFTMATKYDTQKLQNLSEFEDRISAKAALLSSGDSSIDNKEWFEEIIRDTTGKSKSILGVFEEDKFFIDFLSHRFAIRNHPMLLRKSISELKNLKPKNVKKPVYLMGFKEDFMFYLYQNSFFRSNNYDGYIFQKDDQLNTLMSVEGNVVSYNSNEVFSKSEAIKNEYSPLLNIFPTEEHFLRYNLELQKINTEIQNAIDAGKEVIDKYREDNYLFLENNKLSAKAKVRMALWRSKNNVAFFSQEFGVWNMLRKIKNKYPELAQMYQLLDDIQPLIDEKQGKANFYLDGLDDDSLTHVYIENLADLKNSNHLEVAGLFQMFDHIAILQSGASTSGITNMNRIIDQDLFTNTIEEEISSNQVLIQLQTGLLQLKSGKSKDEIVIPLLDDFVRVYAEALSIGGWSSRKRGMNLMVELNEGEAVTVNSMTTNKVRIYTKLEGITDTAPQLTIENLTKPKEDPISLGDDVELELNMEFIDNAILSPYVNATTSRLLVSDKELQKELNALLLNEFGIDNTKSPITVSPIAIGYNGTNLSIATAEKTYGKHSFIDEQMANRSTKAIGQETKGVVNPGASTYYTEHILKNFPERLAGGNKKFKETDVVWVYGSSLFKSAWEGPTFRNQKEWSDEVEKTFEAYHKVQIDKAIATGVRTFFVGSSSGIDKLAYSYLTKQNFFAVPKYLPQGKFYEFVKIDGQESYSDDYINVKSTLRRVDANTFKSMFGNIIDTLVDEKLMADTNKLTDQELDKPNASIHYSKVLSNVQATMRNLWQADIVAGKLFRDNLLDTQGASLELYTEKATGLYRTYLEKAILEIRNLFVIQQQKQNINNAKLIGQQQEIINEQILTMLNNEKIVGLEMNYLDGYGNRPMRDEFKGKSTMDLVISGDRTRTTRSASQLQMLGKLYGFTNPQDLVGKLIPVTDTGEYTGKYQRVFVRIKSVNRFTQTYQDDTWMKEGWSKSVTDALVGKYDWAIEFEYVSSESVTLDDVNNVKNCEG